ncbi:centromere-associated protein E isoform X2 [Paroedura picta]|uniref:centromere-associated protein E isoform X2 n=1 Tax=Paroedura picta TaxID=143630 RepID=UPI004055F0A9
MQTTSVATKTPRGTPPGPSTASCPTEKPVPSPGTRKNGPAHSHPTGRDSGTVCREGRGARPIGKALARNSNAGAEGRAGEMADEGAVTVCVRVRPLIERENAELGGKETVAWKSEKCNISQVDGTKSFTFDRVFHSEESTVDVYKEVADPIIKSAVQGYNGTIFAYGQTASGKTYTMLGTKVSPGILPMAIEDVFRTICKIPDREFLLRISYMEIHNETIKDLLCSSIRKKKPLVVREDISRNIYVEDLIEEVVVSPEQVMSWLQKGEKNRHYGETKMNVRSSRSHTIFRMIIESKEKTDASNSNCDGAVMVSHLNLVDLAGSERASQTGNDGIRLKEGCNINRSLFILGQVIKKLCDDQFGGFINYRDSKLTRILQNSLGGNAKTAIICTVTPVSLEETLSTLQFASTAKKMKNSPKVNEVLDDDALLKRYRREIEDLKRRLEEVSSDSHTRDEEKDQLAQLLEEKNSLQIQQQDRIRTLAEMVVTSSSFLREQELKARKKRRVTWAPGALSHSREIFSEDFPERAKRFKASLSALSEMEESVSSVSSEYDDPCLAVNATIPEEEWIPGPEISLLHKDFADSVILCETLAAERDTAITKQEATQAQLETLQVEKDQLSHEVRELTEKIETSEFMVLEKETVMEHEVQLMHEISNLKAVIANAEGYNQDLQNDLKSKELHLKERDHKIITLEKQIIELSSLLEESRKTASTSPVGTSSQAVEEMKRSLSDAEIVAMDAKKESAFLRSENVALNERMDQLLKDYHCMKKDTECYRSQLEAGKVAYKKMQSDLQKELQYCFQENTKLTSLLEGKVLKGNQSSVELDENEATALSESSLKTDLEILRKEILEKSEMVISLTSERETLLSQLAEKEQRLFEMTDALTSKEDFANAEAEREKDEAVQELQRHCQELSQELAAVSEENKQMQGQMECLSDENLKLRTTINEMAEELSGKAQELEVKDLEQEKLLCMEEELNHVRQELNNAEQLKDQLKAWESRVEAGEVEKLALVQQLQGREEEIGALAQERDELKQMLEAAQRERDQIKDDIEETVAMNIEAQNELRNSQTSLKQCEKEIKELQVTVLKTESQAASIQETLETTINEQKIQILKLTEDFEQATLEKNQLSARVTLLEENETRLMREQIFCLEEEKTKLQQQLDALQEEKHQSQESHQLFTSHGQGSPAKGLQEEELSGVKEELAQALQKLGEMGEQLKSNESKTEADRMAMAQELYNREEAVSSLIKERDHLRHQRDALQLERNQVHEEMQATQSMLSSKVQELQDKEKEHEELLQMLKEQHSGEVQQNESEMHHLQAQESKLEAREREKPEVAERLHHGEEERKSLVLERDDLKQMWEAVQMENEKLEDLLKDTTLKLSSKTQDLEVAERELLHLKEQLCNEAEQNQSEMGGLREQLGILASRLEAKEREELEMAERLQGGEEERKALALEWEDLKRTQEALQIEKETLKEQLEEATAKGLELQENLENAKGSLKEYHRMVEELRGENSQASEKEEDLRQTAEQLKQKVVDAQAEVEKLVEKTTSQELQISWQENVMDEQEKQLRKLEAELAEEAAQLKEKVEQLTEKLSLQAAESGHLLAEREAAAERMQQLGMENSMLKKERDDAQQAVENAKAENDQLQHSLLENTKKLEQLTEKLSLQTAENGHLLSEREALAKSVQQLGMENSVLKKERDDTQQAVENAKAENDQLRLSLLENTEKFSQTNGKLEQDLQELRQRLEKAHPEETPESKEQDALEKLQAKVSRITEALQTLPGIEKRYEYLERIALNLKAEVNHHKETAAKVIEEASCEKAKQVRRLQMEHEVVSNSLHRLLKKLQVLLTRLCKKKGEYYVNIRNYTLELLSERGRQHELLTQIQRLKEPCWNSPVAVSQQLRIPELNQHLDFYVEQIWKDVSQMDEEVGRIEVMLQPLESDGTEVKGYSVPFDVEAFETGIKQDSERLLPVCRPLKPKAQALMEAREELESRNADSRRETEDTLKTCRERTRELLQALNTLKEKQAPNNCADILEEENYRLRSKVKAQDEDSQDLKLKIQGLENAANGARKNLLEKEKRIAVLEMELKVRASKSEVFQLRAALEEKENCLTSTLVENQTLKAQLNKGSELYKEELEDLKMQLARADMTLTKQSKCFAREMANAKALAEHRDEQLRKLREDLRKAQREQDTTIMSSQDFPQPPLPITCGGGSGIVQNTQVLVLQSEHAKLEREIGQLKKEHELVLKNELRLKDEVKKWKERALKMREQSRIASEERRLKSPRKTAPPLLTELPPSPSKGRSLQPVSVLDTPSALLNCPTTFFDNSRLGTINDTRLAGGESTESACSEDSLKLWMAKASEEGTSECKTQ